jgi:hypothetical protein
MLIHCRRAPNISQRVSREKDHNPSGVIGCLTPDGSAFLTREGRPVIGIECFMMQGLPAQRLIFSRESQRNLQDLAGNAMTSTIAGAAIMSALISAQNYGFAVGTKDTTKPLTQRKIPKMVTFCDSTSETIDLTAYSTISVEKIVMEACRSVRLCEGCEKHGIRTKNKLQRCINCGYTSCMKCGNDGKHEYATYNPPFRRIDPSKFEALIKNSLPMRMKTPNISADILQSIYQGFLENDADADADADDLENINVDEPITEQNGPRQPLKITSFFKPAVTKLDTSPTVRKRTTVEEIQATCLEKLKSIFSSGMELRFSSVERSGVWTVRYESEHARLDLVVDKVNVEWRMFAKPDAHEAGNSKVRAAFMFPFLYMKPTGDDIVKGNWKIWKHSPRQFEVEMHACGKLIPSFKNALGLEDFAEEYILDEYMLLTEDNELATDVVGPYKLFTCGDAAEQSLHVRMPLHPDGEHTLLFLDVGHYTDPQKSPFVISTNSRRLPNGEQRPNIIEILNIWRPTIFKVSSNERKSENFAHSNYHETEFVLVESKGRWEDLPGFQLQMESDVTGEVMRASQTINGVIVTSCEQSYLAVEIRGQLHASEISKWVKFQAVDIDDLHQLDFFKDFASLVQKNCQVEGLQEWQVVLRGQQTQCLKCAPSIPAIKWGFREKKSNRGAKDALYAFEDRQETTGFENAVKNRPASFSIQIGRVSNRTAALKLAINPLTLMHRAAAKINRNSKAVNVELSWCLKTDYTNRSYPNLPTFKLRNNNENTEADQPGGFNEDFRLRPEQLRSLNWMLSQENDPQEFLEEEVEEGIIPSIGWRLQGRAVNKVLVRGGVLADGVGYGKTVTTLALIDTQRGNDKPPAKTPGCIPIKASLILAPIQLCKQWEEQCEESFENRASNYDILAISTIANLQKLTIKRFQVADIIIAPWSIFDGEPHLRRVAPFAGLLDPPIGTGMPARASTEWYKSALAAIARNVDMMQDDPSSVYDKIKNDFENAKLAASKQEMDIPSKRYVGQGYVDQKTKSNRENLTGHEGGNVLNVAKGNKKTAAKKTPTPWQDNFGLKDLAKTGDFTMLTCPLFEMFEFSRVIVDEFAHTKRDESMFISALHARARWILSGTPKMQNSADIKKMALFIGIHLGVDDITPGMVTQSYIEEVEKNQTGK